MSNTLFLRIALGSVFLFHGAGKVLMGVDGFAEMFDLNIVVAYLVTFAELAGGIGILAGNYVKRTFFGLSVTKLSAVAMIPVLFGAIFLVHLPNGYSFMNNGWEFQSVLLLLGLYFLFEKEEDIV